MSRLAWEWTKYKWNEGRLLLWTIILDQDDAGFAGLQMWFQALSLSDQGYMYLGQADAQWLGHAFDSEICRWY